MASRLDAIFIFFGCVQPCRIVVGVQDVPFIFSKIVALQGMLVG